MIQHRRNSHGRLILLTLLLVTSLSGCSNDEIGLVGQGSSEWLISPVLDAGPGKDGIPALEYPLFVSAYEVNYMEEHNLVIGIVYADQVRAYPHAILNWHEIINDGTRTGKVTVTYCPLTGTAIVFSPYVEGKKAVFGVSGLLYNSNLIAYDRLSGSNWSQMLMMCVNGPFIGKKLSRVPLIETTWGTWQKMFPDTKILSDNTGYKRPYRAYPYFHPVTNSDYRTDHGFLLFPPTYDDPRLPRKERVHGIIANEVTKVYPFRAFSDRVEIINDVVGEEPVVVVASGSDNLIVSFSRRLSDGSVLTFDRSRDTVHVYPSDLVSEDGTVWDILGRAVSGTRVDQRLNSTVSYNAYWFAWGAVFRGAEIYSP